MVLASIWVPDRSSPTKFRELKLTPRKSELCAMPESTVPVPFVLDRLAAKFGPPAGLGAEKTVWWSN